MPGRRLVLDASTAILLAKVDLLREVTSRGAVIMAGTAVDEALARDSDDARLIRRLLDERSIGPVAAPAGADALAGRPRRSPPRAKFVPPVPRMTDLQSGVGARSASRSPLRSACWPRWL